MYKLLLILMVLGTVTISNTSCSRAVTTAQVMNRNGKVRTVRMSKPKCVRKRARIAKRRHHRVKGYGIN